MLEEKIEKKLGNSRGKTRHIITILSELKIYSKDITIKTV